LRGLNNGTTILGGDFNTTWDDRHVDVNLDTHAMQNVPSLFRTNKLRELCTTFELVDPYRALYPNKKDFTYVPSAVDNLNSSRIDMFLINVRLLPHVKDCLISPGLLTAHFDHKCTYKP
jgi:exonuclease III